MTGAPAIAWRAVNPAAAHGLVDARLQLHHASQLGAALGISYLDKQADDSHTNLEWLAPHGALASNRAGPEQVRVAVAVEPLVLLVLDASNGDIAELPLHGRTVNDAVRWLRDRLAECGLDPARFTTKKHYTIPTHAVADGAPFDATAHDAFAELAKWYGDADAYFDGLAARARNASTVRCWPHHFDLGMLFEPAAGTTIGVGMEPGDNYYAEPYWYANVYPGLTSADTLPALDGGGSWHSQEWIGAVLTGSRMQAAAAGDTNHDGAAQQSRQVGAFFESAFRAYGG